MNQGMHLLIDTYGLNPEGQTNSDIWYEILDTLPGILGMTKMMAPYVVHHTPTNTRTGMVVIAESHLSMRTYQHSDHGLSARIDLFSCKPFDDQSALEHIRRQLGNGESIREPSILGVDGNPQEPTYRIKTIRRGIETHLLLDVFGQDPEKLRDATLWYDTLDELAQLHEGRVEAAPYLVRFKDDTGKPAGVTGMVLTSRGEAAVHTYPENKFYAMDVTGLSPNDITPALNILQRKIGQGTIEENLSDTSMYTPSTSTTPFYRVRSIDRGFSSE